jgi:hypothetical protein
MRRCSIEDVCSAVCLQYGVHIKDLLGERRIRSLVEPRHVAFYLARKHGKMGVSEIARHFNRDHTTVSVAASNIARDRMALRELDSHISAIEAYLALQLDVGHGERKTTNPRIALLIPRAMIDDFERWCERAPGAYFDQRGRLCMADADFIRASEDAALPIAVFLPEVAS